MKKYRLTLDVRITDDEGGQQTLPVTFEGYGESPRDAAQRFSENLAQLAPAPLPRRTS